MKTRKPTRGMNVGEARAERLKSISATLDLGHGLTLESYVAKLADARATLGALNTAIAEVDELRATLRTQDLALRDLNEQILRAVAGAFGVDSIEYATAGGVRKSERAKPVRKPKDKTIKTG